MWLWLLNAFLRSALVAVLMIGKGIQLDMKETCSPSSPLLSSPSHIKTSFFNKVRFYDDTKRKTFALPTLAHKGYLWLDGYAARYILIMHRRKWNFFNHAAQEYKKSETLKWFPWLALTRRDSPLAYCLMWSIYSQVAIFRKIYSTWELRDKYQATVPSRLPNNYMNLKCYSISYTLKKPGCKLYSGQCFKLFHIWDQGLYILMSKNL